MVVFCSTIGRGSPPPPRKASLPQDYCDILTRGLSFNEFVKQFSFWQHGPPWHPDFQDSWPDSALGYLSAASKSLVAPSSNINATFNVDVVISAEPLVDVERFSSFSKALRVTTLVFKAISRMRKSRGPGKYC